MAEEKVGIKVQVDTKDASKQVDNLNNKVQETGKSAKNAEKNAKSAGGAFATIGNALKSLGIITVISKGFEFFQQVLGKNQKVADALTTAMNFLTGVFSDLISFIVDNAGTVVAFFKDIFENPVENIKAFGNAIVDNIIERVKSLFDAFGLLGETVKNLFTGEFDAAIESAKKFGKEVVDVVTGVDGAFDKSKKFITDAADAAGDYFGKKLKQAQDLTKATNNAVIAEAAMVNAIKQTEIAAEKLRQKRDDENLSIQERIKANDDLAAVLKKGQQQELALIGIRAQKVQAEIALNGQNKELQAELIRLQGERADIEEKYTAFASEQLINRNALLKEQADIEKSLAENQNKLVLDTQKANAELIKDDIEKLEVKKKILQEESDLELKRLQDNINNTKAGTAARAEAEIAYAQKKNEIDNALAATEDQIAVAKFNREFAALEQQASNQQISFELRQQAIDAEQEQLDQAYANRLISEKDYTDKSKKLSGDRIATELAEKEAKAAINNAYLDLATGFAGLAKGIFEKSKGVQIAGLIIEQAAAVGKIIQNTAVANAKALAASPLTGGLPWIPINTATAALSVANAIATTAKGISQIRSANSSGGGASAGAAPTISAAAPVAPPAPQATLTQLDNQSINQLGSATSRAYVLESDVTNGQERIKRINRAARLG